MARVHLRSNPPMEFWVISVLQVSTDLRNQYEKITILPGQVFFRDSLFARISIGFRIILEIVGELRPVELPDILFKANSYTRDS